MLANDDLISFLRAIVVGGLFAESIDDLRILLPLYLGCLFVELVRCCELVGLGLRHLDRP